MKPFALIACHACGNFQIFDGRVTVAPERLPKLRTHLRTLLGNGNLLEHGPSNTFVCCADVPHAMFHIDARTRRLSIREKGSDVEREAARQLLVVILDQLEGKEDSEDVKGLDDN